MRSLCFAFVCLVLVGCAATKREIVKFRLPESESLGTPDANDRDAILEAVFRHQFDDNGSYQKQSASAYFLALGEKRRDPSNQFVKRFVEHKPAVYSASACTKVNMRVVDKKTGKTGLMFYINTINWISSTDVEVNGGYEESGLSASGNTYTVVRKDKKWQVTKDKVDWMA